MNEFGFLTLPSNTQKTSERNSSSSIDFTVRELLLFEEEGAFGVPGLEEEFEVVFLLYSAVSGGAAPAIGTTDENDPILDDK